MVETIVFKGVKFRRYPDSTRRSDAVYYTPGIADKQRGTRRLHEEIWAEANGPIPKGHHIHHIDGNPLNNDLDNLEAKSRLDHVRHHLAGTCTERQREHLEEIRPLAAVWHSSPEGLEWHRQHAYTSIRAIPPVDHVCDQCGATFEAIPKKHNRFCSNNCKSAWRRASGLDDVQKICETCGNAFTSNKYAKRRACSIKCGAKLSGDARRKPVTT